MGSVKSRLGNACLHVQCIVLSRRGKTLEGKKGGPVIKQSVIQLGAHKPLTSKPGSAVRERSVAAAHPEAQSGEVDRATLNVVLLTFKNLTDTRAQYSRVRLCFRYLSQVSVQLWFVALKLTEDANDYGCQHR